MPELDTTLATTVRAWRDDDPDPETRAELDRLLAESNEPELRDRFGAELEFGTAGLRGVLGAGPNRMNRRVVLRATAGLVAWVKEQVKDAATRGVVLGYDGRRGSAQFARDAAEIIAGAGLVARVFDRMVPTPVLAYAALERNAAAGIMVTASHNPPAYNGYKVYWENGAQIIPPNDAGIAACIARVERVADLPRLDRETASARGLYETLGDATEERYLAGVRALLPRPETPRDLVIAYTALHGVGDRFTRRALADAGFERVFSVPEQAEPDGAFPTVAFPNPEEKGAMDLALALGRAKGADIVLANDPDADRLAVAVRDRDGRYEMLTGNDVGCLLAHYLLEAESGDDRIVLSSIVSSPWLGAIAKGHGADFRHTLTGFKWIANEAIRIARETTKRFVLGYEEALGYTVGTLVRDKDGVSAAAVVADMAAWCKSQGRTLLEEREVAWRRYGMFLSAQIAATLPGADGAARIRAIMDAMHEDPPRDVGGIAVSAVSDLEKGTRTTRDGAATRLDYPPTDLVILELEGAHRIMARPSGTEPKIKIYFDARVDVGASESIADARARGEALLARMTAALRVRTGL